jgi:hypothetical protein
VVTTGQPLQHTPLVPSLLVNPRFPRAQCLEALNDEISDLSSPMHGLFQIKTLNIDYNGSDVMINLTGVTAIIDLVQVSVRYMTDDYPIARKVRLMRDLPTDDFASGFAIRFDQGVFPGRLRVVYKAPYATAATESVDVNSTGGVQETLHRYSCYRNTDTFDVTTRSET